MYISFTLLGHPVMNYHESTVAYIVIRDAHPRHNSHSRDIVTRKVFKLRLWGFRLGPADLPHPRLTSVLSPFNLLRSFKEDIHQSKTDFTIV